MKRTRLSELKRSLTVGIIAYRDDIKKAILKLALIANMIMFILSLLNNMPSMLLYLANVHFLYKFMIEHYPETKLRRKDRFISE